MDGVWESARACMRNYLILRDKVQAFRADPEVAEALAAAGVPDLDAADRRAEGESLDDAARRRRTTSRRSAPARSAMEALDQLAMEHLLGVR